MLIALTHLGSISDDKFDTGRGSLEKFYCLLMMFSLYTDTIDTEELVTTLETPVPVRHATGDDATDVDGRVLLFTSHYTDN